MQATQRGEIGIVLQAPNYVPYSSKSEDVDAANRLMDFSFGWLVKLSYHVINTSFLFGNFLKKNREGKFIIN